MARLVQVLRYFVAIQDLSQGELDAILTNPEFATAWWDMFEYSYHRHLERHDAQPTTPWDWNVHTIPGGHRIIGTCQATSPSGPNG